MSLITRTVILDAVVIFEDILVFRLEIKVLFYVKQVLADELGIPEGLNFLF